MNIVFMGTPEFSVKILEAVHNEYGVNLVVTQPDKLVGRKKVLTFNPIKEKALELGIKIFQPSKIKEDFKTILDAKPDLIITAAYGQIIPNEVIDFPRLGAINVHGSLLPLLRGGAPIQRAIQRQHQETGVTIMYMAYKMDSGDIICQKLIPILPEDTSGSLFAKLSILGKDLLLETLPSIINGTNRRVKQDISKVTYAYNLKRLEERINWDLSKEEINAHVRAFSPKPNCYTTIDGKQIKIHKVDIFECANFEKNHSNQKNGIIVKIFKDSIGVKCQNGIIRILEIQLAGKVQQDVYTFMNGAGRKLISVDKLFE